MEKLVAVQFTEEELQYLIEWTHPENYDLEVNDELENSVKLKLLDAKEHFPHA